MIRFNEVDDRLKGIEQDRTWLAQQTRRSPETIIGALAPNADPRKQSKSLQGLISDAIEREELRRQNYTKSSPPPAIPAGHTAIYLTGNSLARADRASRLATSPSLHAFCVEAILQKADEIIEEEERRRYAGLKVAEEPVTSAAKKNGTDGEGN